MQNENRMSNPEFNFIKGVFAALLVGITGSAMSLGMEQGKPVADYFEKSGVDPLIHYYPGDAGIAFRHTCHHNNMVSVSGNS